jgi:NTE family protein
MSRRVFTQCFTQSRLTAKPIEALPHALIDGIANDEIMGALSSTSKYNADWEFLTFLHDHGPKCVGDWLTKNFVKLGVCGRVTSS